MLCSPFRWNSFFVSRPKTIALKPVFVYLPRACAVYGQYVVDNGICD
jgi:hypothetical protein